MRIELPSLAVRKVQCTIYCIYVLNAKENTLLLLLHCIHAVRHGRRPILRF